MAVACKAKHCPSKAREIATECLNLIILIPDYQHSQTAVAASMDPSGGTDSSSCVGQRDQQARVARLASSASSSSAPDTDRIAAEIVGEGIFAAVGSVQFVGCVDKRLRASELTRVFDNRSQAAAPSFAVVG